MPFASLCHHFGLLPPALSVLEEIFPWSLQHLGRVGPLTHSLLMEFRVARTLLLRDREQPLARSGRNSVLLLCVVATACRSRVNCLCVRNRRTLSVEGTVAVPSRSRLAGPGRWRTHHTGRKTNPRRARWNLQPGRWRLIVAGAWKEAQRIHLFEARAALPGFRWACSQQWGTVVVSLWVTTCLKSCQRKGDAQRIVLSTPFAGSPWHGSCSATLTGGDAT